MKYYDLQKRHRRCVMNKIGSVKVRQILCTMNEMTAKIQLRTLFHQYLIWAAR